MVSIVNVVVVFLMSLEFDWFVPDVPAGWLDDGFEVLEPGYEDGVVVPDEGVEVPDDAGVEVPEEGVVL